MTEMFAAVRVQKIKGMRNLQSIEAHGRREDEASKGRVDADRTENNLAWSCVEGNPLGVVAAFRKRKVDTGAGEYAGAPVGIHVMCIVSPDWISGAGDMHDPRNPRNKALFEAAKEWGDRTFGAGSVVAARMDMDERGGGVVDLVVVPVATFKQRGKEKTQISVNKAYEKAFGGGRVYSRMQDSWASHAQRHLDATLKRGKTKEETQREHVHADIIRPALQRAEAAEKAAKAWRKDAEKWRNRSKAMQKRIAEQKAMIDNHEKEIATFKKGIIGKFATAREEDLKEKVEEIRVSESAKNDALLLRAQRAEGSLNEAREGRAESSRQLAKQIEKYNLIVGHVRDNVPGAAEQIRKAEAVYDEQYGGGGQSQTQEAGIQHDDDEATRNLKIATARESAVNAANARGPSM